MEPVPHAAPDPLAPPTRRRQRWSDLSSGRKTAIVLGGLVELIITSLALRDLLRRPARQVRGRKPLWALSFVVQPFGPLAYFLVGRKRA